MALGASASSSSAGEASMRRGPERRVMDVRVWYTLESSPHRMLAPLGRPTSIELLPPMRRTSNSTSEMAGMASSAPQRFGKVTLKTCLSAICISSPELIMDRKRDFILYVVDPEETYKAAKRQRPHRATTLQSPSAASSSRDRDSPKDPNSIFVGRGFFGWILEEEGDGDTVVMGKVTSERSDRSWESSHDSDPEEDEQDLAEYLDVEIRMKETQAQSREQYFNMLKQFGGGGTRDTKAAAKSIASSVPPARKQVVSLSSPPQRSRSNGKSQAGSSRFSTGLSGRTTVTQNSSSPILPQNPLASIQLPPGTSSFQQAQAVQLLALVQALQARQAQTQKANQDGGQGTIPTRHSHASMTGGTQSTGISRSMSQPQFNRGFPFAGLPRNHSAADISSLSETAFQESPAASTSNSKTEAMYQCYNCGIEDKIKAVWRIVTLTEGTKVQYPHAFESNPCKDAAAVEERQNLDVDSEGWVTANGRSSWRACNRCGLFWQKWKKSRPEKLEKRRIAPKRKPREGPAGESDIGDEDERDEIEHSSPVAGRETPQPQQPPPPRKRVRHRATAEEPELIMDEFGQLRSKRSIRENPEGKRPGRPKGCKTGEGKGKSRDAKNRERSVHSGGMPGSEPGDDHPHGQARWLPTVAQSSPGRPMGSRTFPWDSSTATVAPSKAGVNQGILHSTPGATPARQRYGAPSHILDSSPTTALDALLDCDFNNFDFNNPQQVMSFVNSFSGLTSGGLEEAPRRSPRKNPPGTREEKNPYATTSDGSPSGKSTRANGQTALSSLVADASVGSITPTLDVDVFSAFTNFKSPVSTMKTSHRANGASRLIPTSSPSSGVDDGSEDRPLALDSSALTSLTSPVSPSPSRKRLDLKLSKGRSQLPKSHSANSLIFSSSPTTRSQSGKTPVHLGRDSIDDDVEDEDGPGGDSPTMARKGRMSSNTVCPASPSLGQKRKRDAAAAATLGSKTILPRFNVTGADGVEARLTKGVTPSPAKIREAEKALVSSMGVPVQSRSTSLSPAHRKKLGSSPNRSPMSTALVAHRKPLPATVEDAPSSSAGSSPRDDLSVLSPYDHGTVESYLDMLEDPYGLLQASNFGISDAGGGSVEIQGNGFMSLDHFAGGIQLHDKFDFGQHLQDFTEEGSRGVAAYALPGVTLNEGRNGEGGSNGKEPAQGTSIAGTPFDASGPTSEGQTPVLEPRSPNTLLTPTKKSGAAAAASTPKSSSKRGAASIAVGNRPTVPPTTPGKTRSSPRFAGRTDKTGAEKALGQSVPVPPPQTPRLPASSSATSIGPDGGNALIIPRTPSSKQGVNPTSLALASAVARSPALQRVLNAASPGGAGEWDFSALLGAHGSLSPLFATPGLSGGSRANINGGGLLTPRRRGGSGGSGDPIPFPDLTPLSPGLSRLLNSIHPIGDHQQERQLVPGVIASGKVMPGDEASASSSSSSSFRNKEVRSIPTSTSDQSQVRSKSGLDDLGEEIRQEAFMDFQAMMQDPAFRELWDNANASANVGGESGVGNGNGRIAGRSEGQGQGQLTDA